MHQKIIWIYITVGLLLVSCTAPSTDPSETNQPKVKEATIVQSQKGKQLFLENCALCHNINMVDDMTGPALYGVEERWSKVEDLIHFVQNPQELINNNHERAVKISELWPSEMTAFPQLDSVAIQEVLAFVAEKGAQNN